MRIFWFLGLFLALSTWVSAQPIGKVLPDFQFRSTGGDAVTLSSLRESSPTGVVLLTFWCTNCNSCRATEQHLAKLSRDYHDRAAIFAVASSRDDTAQDVRDYLENAKLELPVLMDNKSELARYLKVVRTTSTAIFDDGGRLRYFGTLKRRRKFYAKTHLESVLAQKIVGQPKGPIYG